MKVLLDFDSTTADLIQHQVTCCNKRFGTTYHHDQFANWNWWFENTEPEHIAYVWGDECFLNREWTLSIPPVRGAINGISNLITEGHQLFLVSDRADHMKEWLHTWLWQQGIAIPIYTTSKEPGNTKLDVARRLGLSVAIEDAAHHAASMSQSGVFERVILLDKPWNRHVPAQPRLTRVLGWEHFPTKLHI